MDQLASMGFEESAAREALEACNGNMEAALNVLLGCGGAGDAAEQVVVLGCSQYTFEVGSSACTPIACTFVTSILTSLRNRDTNYLDSAALTDLMFTGVGSYLAAMGNSSDHLAAEELYNISDTLKSQLGLIGSPHQGMVTTPRVFELLIADVRSSAHLVSPDQHIGVVLTKPPETVGFIVPPAGKEGQFIFFDSHARPHYGFEGAYLVAGQTQDTITTRLNGLFESDLGGELGADILTSTYNMFEATVFQLNQDSPSSSPAPPREGDATSADNPKQQPSEQHDTTQDATDADADVKAAAPAPGAAAKKNSSRRRNPGIGMGVRIRRDRDQAQSRPTSQVPLAERTLIDRWIRTNDLNQFGDPKGVMYAGGTPLFDERTATRKERYEYIVSRHPGRPWVAEN